MALSLAIAEAGPDSEVAVEATYTYGWYWAADVLQARGLIGIGASATRAGR